MQILFCILSVTELCKCVNCFTLSNIICCRTILVLDGIIYRLYFQYRPGQPVYSCCLAKLFTVSCKMFNFHSYSIILILILSLLHNFSMKLLQHTALQYFKNCYCAELGCKKRNFYQSATVSLPPSWIFNPDSIVCRQMPALLSVPCGNTSRIINFIVHFILTLI